MIKRFKKHKFFQFAIVFIILFLFWVIWSNLSLEVNRYTISDSSIPASFNGYKVALVTDLHNYQIGQNNETLLEQLKACNPDMIAIVGDIVDCYDTDISIAIEFAESATQIAPTYYVTGNHEAFIEELDKLEKGLTSAGVTILHNEVLQIEQNGETITLIGLDDPSFTVDYFTGDSASAIDTTLHEITIEEATFSLLLSHRPELFDVYVKHDIDLVLSGHAHGGQFRLPFIGGLYSPNQGIFPKYDAGLFTEQSTSMIVSRGLGNSAFPIRFNNRPELILIELQSERTS